jgi:hypothetical protein
MRMVQLSPPSVPGSSDSQPESRGASPLSSMTRTASGQSPSNRGFTPPASFQSRGSSSLNASDTASRFTMARPDGQPGTTPPSNARFTFTPSISSETSRTRTQNKPLFGATGIPKSSAPHEMSPDTDSNEQNTQ